jgi:hypothetical protein
VKRWKNKTTNIKDWEHVTEKHIVLRAVQRQRIRHPLILAGVLW